MLCLSHYDKKAMVIALRQYDIWVTLRWHDIFIILRWHDICITFTTWYLHHIVTRRQCSWECDDKVIVVALLSHDICVTLPWHDICIWLWWGGHARQNVIRRLCLSHCDDNNMVVTLRCHDICVTLWWKDICIKLWQHDICVTLWHYMFITLQHIMCCNICITLQHIKCSCNIMCSSYCVATLYVHHIASYSNITVFVILQHYYVCDTVILHCLSKCDITMFVTLRQKGWLFRFQQQGNVHHIATLHWLWDCDITMFITSMLICSSHFNITMFVTFQYYYVREVATLG